MTDPSVGQRVGAVTVKYASKYVHITPGRKPLRAGADTARSTVDGIPAFESNAVLVVDFSDGQTLYAKNPQNVTPIASITKLMTAMVVLDAGLPLDEELNIEIADFDFLKFTHSRLGMGSRLARREPHQGAAGRQPFTHAGRGLAVK